MARTAKKEKALTPGKKLAQALVPEGEQPYQVPKNWCWVVQGRVSTFFNGRAYKQAELLEDETKTPVLRVGNLFTNTSWYYSDLKLEENKYIDNEDLIYAWSASFGPFIWQGGKAIYHYHIWKVELTSALKKKYYYYWLLNDTERLKKQGHGTGMIHVTKEMMENSAMPLPPLAEQQRIVDRIESLFAKLDEAKEKAQAVVDGFEDRKAAIQHKAFAGELTEIQRKKQGVGFDSWESVTLNDIVSGFKYGTSEKSDYSFSGMPVLRIPNIGDDGIDFSDIKKLSSQTVEAANRIHENDILIIRSNGSRDLVGKCALVPHLDQEYAYASFLICIRPSERVSAEYLVLFLNSADARTQMFAKAKSSAGINNINSKELGAILLKLPELWEQEEISHHVSKLLLLEKRAKEAAEQVIDQIDAMKKSILARAFRGELGTNNPNDESAVELLKRVLCDDVPAPQREKPIKIPKELSKSLRNDLEKRIIKLYFQRSVAVLSIKEIMSVSSKTLEILDCLRSLHERQIIIKQEDGNYKLMG